MELQDLFKVYTLGGIKSNISDCSIIQRRRVNRTNKKSYYQLLNSLTFCLSNGDKIIIEKGFEWDLSSVPRFLWWLFPPDGDFEVASLIHDYLYINRKKLGYTRKFVDREMLQWSISTSGTKKISFRNIDNYIRYYTVRLFGGLVWNGIIKL